MLNTARDKQLEPDGEWSIWLLLAGRGFGKTRTAVENMLKYATEPGAKDRRIAVVAATQGDLRKTCFEGESGLLACCPRELIKGGDWNKSTYEMQLWNGALIQGFSADRPDRLRGPQFHRGWADELSSWRYPDAWDMLEFTMRLGDNPRILVTTTPKPVPLIKTLVRQKGVHITDGNTFENQQNLSSKFLQRMRDKYEGTKLGQQELYGALLEEIEGALWKRSMIHHKKPPECPTYKRIVVAVDPAVTAHEDSDETGIVVVGYGHDGNYYVLDDLSGTHDVAAWPRLAVRAYHDYEADAVVCEVNQGGDLVEAAIRNEGGRTIKIKQVRATRGKVLRAEPIAQLYEKGKVFHVGVLPSLEDQMCSFDPLVMEKSPDRVDALVWGLTELSGEEEARLRVRTL